MKIDRNFTLETLAGLVEINFVNPSLVPGAPGEKQAANYFAGWMWECGLSVENFELEPRPVTVLGRLPGGGPVAQPGQRPPARRPAGGRRADEEYGSLGTTGLLTHLRVDGAIVTETTALNVCLAHKGYLWIEVEVTGRAAHGSRFDFGIDANRMMGQFLHRLSELERGLRAHAASADRPAFAARGRAEWWLWSEHLRSLQHRAHRAPDRARRDRGPSRGRNPGHRRCSPSRDSRFSRHCQALLRAPSV
jgi:acetylornithine deacetylase/succinyl-diaminopimelate desuccinylase-like protein